MFSIKLALKFLLVFFLLINLSMAQVPPPTHIRAVQCGAFPTQEEANLCKTRLQTLGYGPIWQKNDKDLIKVLVGKCETLADSVILRDSLRENGFPDAFTKGIPNDEQKDFTTQAIMPNPPLIFPSQPVKDSFPQEKINFSSRQELAALNSALSTKDDSQIITQGMSLLASLSDSDPAKGWVMNKISYSMIRKEKKSPPALPYILKVAKGEAAALEQDRIDARWMAADSWYYFIHDRMKAYQAYSEILKNLGNNPGIKARAMVEKTACLLELARNQHGFFDEVRRACKQIMEQIPPQYQRAHAVADLIYAESYMYAGDKQKALECILGFKQRHPQRLREISMANQITGWLLAELDRWEEAVPYFEENLNIDLSDSNEVFYYGAQTCNVKERSANWLRWYAKKFNDQERLQKYEKYTNAEEYLTNTPPEPMNFPFPHQYYERQSE